MSFSTLKTGIMLALICCISTSSFAQNNSTMIKPWFQALKPVDREVISQLLADEAQIELKDYDITQTKTEFVEALDSWEDAIENGSIAYKIDHQNSDDDYIITKVCYKFTSNELMTVEMFLFNDGMIVKSVQETVADHCSGF
ncbi:MAG: hypothetical protein JJ858_00925 [Rhizobiaceae bacterium]|nr:hypothetical protein [Rhizobiaceae bacterium]